jgi:hypothetical protein
MPIMNRYFLFTFREKKFLRNFSRESQRENIVKSLAGFLTAKHKKFSILNPAGSLSSCRYIFRINLRPRHRVRVEKKNVVVEKVRPSFVIVAVATIQHQQRF